MLFLGACYSSHGRGEVDAGDFQPDCSQTDGGCAAPDDPVVVAPYCAHPSRPARPESCDPGVSDVGGSCTAPHHRATYEPCAEGQEVCSDDPDAKCAAYTDNPNNSFCAAYCESDSDCPIVPGFAAACNLAWCALLCDDGRCPDNMVCVPDLPFRDCVAAERGYLSVCVPRR